MNVNELKKLVCQAIDNHAEQIIAYAQQVEQNPELGFKEVQTARQTADFLTSLGYSCREEIALTGLKTSLKSTAAGPNIAILGELDAVICPDSAKANPLTGAAHTCGHHVQLGVMAGTALGLKLAGIADELHGNVTFMAVPAEEFIEIAYRSKLRAEGKIHFLGGKQELIYRGEFDDIDIAMMVHSAKNAPQASISIGESSNGFIGKTIQYLGKEAHAAEAPQQGINALNAAMLGLMGIHALRETFYDQDIVRVHPIITKGGDLVNSVPADVRLETYVRAKTMAAIDATHHKVDRALKAGGDAIGAQTIIHTLPGYLPLHCPQALNDLFSDNARQFMPDEQIIQVGHFGGSTDMGDVSHLMPTIHPYVGGATGSLHVRDFSVVDYDAACIIPAKIMAMTVIDLLSGQAEQAQTILKDFTPLLTKEEYIQLLNSYYL
ncbi:amidohydrolase [Anaerospora hongkongensis]|uniref:Peptidase M20 domain-containing protein 2 n=1 Tax=Anaerospora hongkongensis TaxID=244830 RepID=A0A4R1Q4P2_9FIRM|nr:peptidase dimerization domain-containing protein [Anaerospora hongkongensis]TCL36491.1 amidohydrolase [Anaerospora hongkongensis]